MPKRLFTACDGSHTHLVEFAHRAVSILFLWSTGEMLRGLLTCVSVVQRASQYEYLLIFYVNFDHVRVGHYPIALILISWTFHSALNLDSLILCMYWMCILITAPASYEAVSGSQVQEASWRKTLPCQEKTGTGSCYDLWPSRGDVQDISNIIKIYQLVIMNKHYLLHEVLENSFYREV